VVRARASRGFNRIPLSSSVLPRRPYCNGMVPLHFLRYSYREGAVRFTYSSLLIRLSSIKLIGYILASKESTFSSTYI